MREISFCMLSLILFVLTGCIREDFCHILCGDGSRLWWINNDSVNRSSCCFFQNGKWLVYEYNKRWGFRRVEGPFFDVVYSDSWKMKSDSTVQFNGSLFSFVSFDDSQLVLRTVQNGEALLDTLTLVPESIVPQTPTEDSIYCVLDEVADIYSSRDGVRYIQLRLVVINKTNQSVFIPVRGCEYIPGSKHYLSHFTVYYDGREIPFSCTGEGRPEDFYPNDYMAYSLTLKGKGLDSASVPKDISLTDFANQIDIQYRYNVKDGSQKDALVRKWKVVKSAPLSVRHLERLLLWDEIP